MLARLRFCDGPELLAAAGLATVSVPWARSDAMMLVLRKPVVSSKTDMTASTSAGDGLKPLGLRELKEGLHYTQTKSSKPHTFQAFHARVRC